jgi:hypothetical protein
VKKSLSIPEAAFYITEEGIWRGILLSDSLYHDAREGTSREKTARIKVERIGDLFGSQTLDRLPPAFLHDRYKHRYKRYEIDDNVVWFKLRYNWDKINSDDNH